MQRYGNLSGNSGVVAYELAPRSIKLRFEDGGTYVYSYVRPGPEHVEAMKALAKSGRGLSTYVVRHVKDAYEAKLR
jgi:hypothetical protein